MRPRSLIGTSSEPKEFDLLHYLAAHLGRVVTRRQLLADVWDQPYGGSDKTVDVHISWLRRKLGESATSPGTCARSTVSASGSSTLTAVETKTKGWK